MQGEDSSPHLEAGSEVQDWRNTTCWFASSGFRSLPSYTGQDHLSRLAPLPSRELVPPHTLKAIKKIPTRHAHKSTWQSQIFIECSFFQMTTIVSVKLKKSKTNKHSAFLLFLSSIPSLHVSSTFVTLVTLSFCYPLFEQIFNFWQVSSLVHFFRIYGTQLIVNNCTTWNIHKCSQTPLTKKKI